MTDRGLPPASPVRSPARSSSIPMAASSPSPKSSSFTSSYTTSPSSFGGESKIAYSEPHYIESKSAQATLSEVRPITISLAATTWLNTFLDEFLFLILSACSTSSSEGRLELPLTTERFKSCGLLRVLPNQIGRNAALEAELAIELARKRRGRIWRNDISLIKRVQSDDSVETKVGFEELRVWIDVYRNGGGEVEGLAEKVNQRLLRGTSDGEKVRFSPGLALYASTVLDYMSHHVLRAISRVVERDPGRGEAETSDFFSAMKEDDNLWDCFEGMVRMPGYAIPKSLLTVEAIPQRTRSYVERDMERCRTSSGRRTRSSQRRPGSSSGSTGDQSTVSSHGLKRFGSLRSRSTSGAPTLQEPVTPTLSNEEEAPFLEIEEQDDRFEFDQLLRGQGTMKVSLTPNRLKSMESYQRTKASGNAGRIVANPDGEDAFSRPKASPPIRQQPQPAKRLKKLQARSAVGRADEDDDDDELFAPIDLPPKRKKETLKDILDSSPPWESSTAAPSGKLARMGVESAAAGPVGSGKLSKMGVGPEPSVRPSTGSRSRRLQAKDERAPRPNTARDLMDFLAQAPPPPVSMPSTPAHSISESTASKRLGGKLRNLVGRLTSVEDSQQRPPSLASPARLSQPHVPRAAKSVGSLATVSEVYRPHVTKHHERSPTRSLEPSRSLEEFRPTPNFSRVGQPSPSGMLTPESSIEDMETCEKEREPAVVRRPGTATSIRTMPVQTQNMVTVNARAPDTPPASPQSPAKVKRVPVPSMLPPPETCEVSVQCDGPKPRPIRETREVEVQCDASDVAVEEDISTWVELRRLMATGCRSAEECLELLDRALAKVSPLPLDEDEDEARAAEWLLGGGGEDDNSSVPDLSEQGTTEEEEDVDEDEETGVLGRAGARVVPLSAKRASSPYSAAARVQVP